MAGLELPKDVQGRSLVPVLKDPSATVHDGALSFKNGASLRTSDWAYMKYNDGSAELYDMNADPQQFTNLAKDPGRRDTLRRLEQQLARRLQDAGVRSRKR